MALSVTTLLTLALDKRPNKEISVLTQDSQYRRTVIYLEASHSATSKVSTSSILGAVIDGVLSIVPFGIRTNFITAGHHVQSFYLKLCLFARRARHLVQTKEKIQILQYLNNRVSHCFLQWMYRQPLLYMVTTTYDEIFFFLLVGDSLARPAEKTPARCVQKNRNVLFLLVINAFLSFSLMKMAARNWSSRKFQLVLISNGLLK